MFKPKTVGVEGGMDIVWNDTTTHPIHALLCIMYKALLSPVTPTIKKIINIYFLWLRWIPACAQILIDERQEWMHLVPTSEGDSTALVQQFFACLAALMSTQLRSLVINSLADFVSFLSLYKVSYT